MLVPHCGICDIGMKACSGSRDSTELAVNPLGMRTKWAVLLYAIELTFHINSRRRVSDDLA
jgi:hypothetical protein